MNFFEKRTERNKSSHSCIHCHVQVHVIFLYRLLKEMRSHFSSVRSSRYHSVCLSMILLNSSGNLHFWSSCCWVKQWTLNSFWQAVMMQRTGNYSSAKKYLVLVVMFLGNFKYPDYSSPSMTLDLVTPEPVSVHHQPSLPLHFHNIQGRAFLSFSWLKCCASTFYIWLNIFNVKSRKSKSIFELLL